MICYTMTRRDSLKLRWGLAPWFFFSPRHILIFFKLQVSLFHFVVPPAVAVYTSLWSRSEQIFYPDFLPSGYLFVIPSIETFVVGNLYLVYNWNIAITLLLLYFLLFFSVTPSRLICQRVDSVQLNVVLTKDKYMMKFWK